MSKSSVEPQPKPTDDTSMYDPRKQLFKEAMNHQWDMVLELYNDKKVQDQHITRANDTLLHVAISSATEEIVLDLLDILQLNQGITTLYLRRKTNMLYIFRVELGCYAPL